MMKDMLTVTLRQDDGFIKTVGGISVILQQGLLHYYARVPL